MKKNSLIKIIVTFFYAGEFPFAPGTVGSFVGLLLFLTVFDRPWLAGVIFMTICVLGFLLGNSAEKIFCKKDPSEVVIDEVAGIFIVFFMIPLDWVVIVVGFILYRILDIFKPFPAKRLERLKGGYGIMLDDILCGIYANFILRVLFTVTMRQGFLQF